MRHKVLGLGATQMLATSALLTAVALALGLGWQAALIVGLALAMSSTAIAMQSVQQRSLTMTDTGRATLVTLLVQDVAVIPVLASIPVLAATRRVEPIGAEGARERRRCGRQSLQLVDRPGDRRRLRRRRLRLPLSSSAR